MTLVVQLPPEMEQELTIRAGESGREVADLARELIERGLHASRSIDEILAPFRAEVSQSGISDDELDAFFEEAREEVHQQLGR